MVKLRKKAPVNISLGGELRARRRAAGLSQVDVAQRLGTCQATVSNIEAGMTVSDEIRRAYMVLVAMGDVTT